MRISEADAAFRRHVSRSGGTVATLSGLAAVEAMVRFYVDERADGVDIDQDGDMLLFQWGTYDWGEGPSFQYGIVRQLMPTDDDDDDDDIWQLSLTAHFAPADEARTLGDGERWCSSPDDVEEFLDFVRQHPATIYADGHPPSRVELTLGVAG